MTITALAAALSVSADVRWLATQHDFGAFDEDDGKVSATFSFINESDAPLSIDHVRSSCGCTVPEYSRQNVNRGDTATIKVVYNPTGRPGRFSKTLAVKLSDDSTYRLLIKGVVIGAQNTLRSRFPVEAGPIRMRGNMTTFGAVKTGNVKSQFVEVYNASTSPVVPKWTDIPPYLRITAAHDTINPGEQGVYSLVFTPGRSTPYGILTDSLTFNVPGVDPVRYEIAAIVEEDFSILTEKQLANAPVISTDTDMLDYGDFTPGDQPVTLTFKITNKGKDDLLIRRIYTSEPGFTIDTNVSKLKKGKSGTVKVTFDPRGFSAPLLNSRLQVITNDPSHPLTTVRLVGIPR